MVKAEVKKNVEELSFKWLTPDMDYPKRQLWIGQDPNWGPQSMFSLLQRLFSKSHSEKVYLDKQRTLIDPHSGRRRSWYDITVMAKTHYAGNITKEEVLWALFDARIYGVSTFMCNDIKSWIFFNTPQDTYNPMSNLKWFRYNITGNNHADNKDEMNYSFHDYEKIVKEYKSKNNIKDNIFNTLT